MPDLPPIERLQAVTLQPGDIVVVTVTEVPTPEGAAHIRAVLAERLPAGTGVIVKTIGTELDVIRPEEADPGVPHRHYGQNGRDESYLDHAHPKGDTPHGHHGWRYLTQLDALPEAPDGP